MYRTVRRQLRDRLEPYRRGRSRCEAIAVVLIPREHTAVEPRWSPGPGWVEIAAASKWGRRCPDGQFQAAVRSTGRETDDQVLIRGTLSAADLLGFGGITDKPHRLRWMALPGTLSEERLSDTHPAMIYDRWVHQQRATARHRVSASGMPDECYDRYRTTVTRRPDGRYQVMLKVTAWAEYLAADIDDISRGLTRVTRSYGPGARLKLYRPTVEQDVTDPLYADAWRRLQADPVDVAGGTFVDRLTDLVERASTMTTIP